MKSFYLCPRCYALYKDNFKVTKTSNGAADMIRCGHCGKKTYCSYYTVERKEKNE